MKTTKKDIIMQNKIFLWIGAVTGVILLLPLLANLPWSGSDFVIMGILLFGMGFFFVVAARITPRKYRLVIGIGIVLLFLLIWGELAVGLVGTPFAGN